ncbi:Cystathionine beta-lyase [Dirofilaria immitis]
MGFIAASVANVILSGTGLECSQCFVTILFREIDVWLYSKSVASSVAAMVMAKYKKKFLKHFECFYVSE